VSWVDQLIFVADDDPSVLKAVQRLLRSAGYTQVEVFGSPKALLERIDIKRPRLLILDLVMPEMGGTELLRLAREIGGPISAVVMSAHELEMAEARKAGMGMTAFLQKPFSGDDLLKAIDAAASF
jgi:CheY-like chemotaxis protein